MSIGPERKGGRNRHAMLAEVRNAIVSGVLAPGSRLPTRAEMERRFGASPHTVRRAIHQLRGEGFVRVSGRQATYVAAYPHHLYHSRWCLWRRCQAAAGYTGTEDEPRRVAVYSGVEDHVDNREMRALSAAVRAHALAGIADAGYVCPMSWRSLRTAIFRARRRVSCRSSGSATTPARSLRRASRSWRASGLATRPG